MLTSHELLGFMSPALAKEILAYIFESDKPAYKATVAAVAQAEARPSDFPRTPTARGTAYVHAHRAHQAEHGRRVRCATIRAWLVKKHATPCSWIFWNALEIKNRKLALADDLPATVGLTLKLKAAVETLLAKFSARSRGRLLECVQRYERRRLGESENAAGKRWRVCN